MAKLTEKAQNVLSYLQEHDGENLTHLDIADALNMAPRSVTGTVTGLQKRGFAERIETEGKKPNLIHATQAGLNFDVTADLPEV